MSRQNSLNNKITNISSSKKITNNFNISSSQKNLPSFKSYLKQFPLNISEDVIQIVKMIQPLQNDFLQNLKTLKLYKQHLGQIMQQNWYDFLAYLKTIVLKMNKKMEITLKEKQQKITQLLQIIKKNQIQKIQYQNKIEKITNLRQMENAQLTMANNQIDIVNKQMKNIYKILETNMAQVMKYLTILEEKKEKQDQSISNQMNKSLNGLAVLLDNFQKQQNQTGSTLSTMKQMIKAMTKSVKVNTGTQVDQSQLPTNVGQIFNKQQSNIPFDQAQGISVNIESINQTVGILDKMKQKQKQISHQTYQPKKSVQKSWTLTPTLLIFLENMSKQNQIGRVLPYQYVKDFIADVYEQRIKYDNQINSSMVGNAMSFDQFVVFYFLNKYKIRRLAQVKLLQMTISLKYYSKFWSKVQTFCNFLNVIKYQPLSDPNDSPAYKLDYYAQNFFFSIYKHLKKLKFYYDHQGSVYILAEDIKKFIKVILFFTDQMSKSRILVKLQKTVRIFKEQQYFDYDYSVLLILDQFFMIRKKNLNSISKSFSKLYEKNKGYFSLIQTLQVFDCLNNFYKRCQDSAQLYPVQSQLSLAKLYLFSITSGKNNYQILISNFINSVQKYGFDSPYPFIKNNVSKKKNTNQQPTLKQLEAIYAQNQIVNEKQIQNINKNKIIQQTQQIIQNNNQINNNQTHINVNSVRIDVASKLFSQHFSILKELNDYVTIFSRTLASQKNPETLWKSFNQIKVILQRGCQFLKFPLVKQMVK